MASRNKILDTASKLTEKGEYKKALSLYDELLVEKPDDLPVLLRVADLYSKLEEYEEALTVYKKIANHYEGEESFMKATAVYKEMLKLKIEGKLEVYQKLGDLYEKLNLKKDAITYYNIAANLHKKKGDTSFAMKLFKKMSDLADDKTIGKIKLAEVYSEEGREGDAVSELLKTYSDLGPGGDINARIKILEKVIEIEENNMWALKEISALYLKAQEPKRALAKLQLAYKIDHKDLEVLELLAKSFFTLEEREKSKAVYDEMIKICDKAGLSQVKDEILRKVSKLFSGEGTEEINALEEKDTGKWKEEEVEIVPDLEVSEISVKEVKSDLEEMENGILDLKKESEPDKESVSQNKEDISDEVKIGEEEIDLDVDKLAKSSITEEDDTKKKKVDEFPEFEVDKDDYIKDEYEDELVDLDIDKVEKKEERVESEKDSQKKDDEKLKEVDFFIEQGLFDEALEILKKSKKGELAKGQISSRISKIKDKKDQEEDKSEKKKKKSVRKSKISFI